MHRSVVYIHLFAHCFRAKLGSIEYMVTLLGLLYNSGFQLYVNFYLFMELIPVLSAWPKPIDNKPSH